MEARAGLATGPVWRDALAGALAQIPDVESGPPWDLVFLFASDSYGRELPALLTEVRRRTGAGVLIGCTSQGVIGTGREVDNEAGVSLLAFSLPGARLSPCRSEERRVGKECRL